MTRPAAAAQADAMLQALASAHDPDRTYRQREQDRHAVLDVLDWLWDVMAEPVLRELGYTGAPGPGQDWPRLWWCPTGPLTVLPLHAAGHHPRHRGDTASRDTVPDRVVSSYTPTLAALSRARRPLPPSGVRQLSVGVADVPGLPPLPAVPQELEILASHFPTGPANRQITGQQATRGTVLGAVPGHSWVHLACHARQRQDDPTRSGFDLWDAVLTINDLASQPTQQRELAFLSACETAAGSVRHLDEAIHLAAAMQFLGYRHVIATMWTIADMSAPRVADGVYSMIAPGQADLAALALHEAVGSLRREDPANPVRWAPYIHLGP